MTQARLILGVQARLILVQARLIKVTHWMDQNSSDKDLLRRSNQKSLVSTYRSKKESEFSLETGKDTSRAVQSPRQGCTTTLEWIKSMHTLRAQVPLGVHYGQPKTLPPPHAAARPARPRGASGGRVPPSPGVLPALVAPLPLPPRPRPRSRPRSLPRRYGTRRRLGRRRVQEARTAARAPPDRDGQDAPGGRPNPPGRAALQGQGHAGAGAGAGGGRTGRRPWPWRFPPPRGDGPGGASRKSAFSG